MLYYNLINDAKRQKYSFKQSKANLLTSPLSPIFQTNHEHVFLQGEDKLYVNTGDVTCRSSQYNGSEAHILVGSKQWQVIPISHSYLAANWPIRVGGGPQLNASLFGSYLLTYCPIKICMINFVSLIL